MKWFSIVLLALAACQPSPPPTPAPPPVGSARDQVSAGKAAMKSARYALEPPRNAWQARDAESVLRMDKAIVTPELLLLQIAAMQGIAEDTAQTPEDRAAANVVAATGEGLLIEHFTTMFWNKAEPGKRVLAYLQQAIELDPRNSDAAIAYTLALFGIRKSGFRSQAEDTMGVKTGPELARIAPLLAQHRGDLLAQSLLRHTLDSLRQDGQLVAGASTLSAGLDERIAKLRAGDADFAAEVDAQLREYVD